MDRSPSEYARADVLSWTFAAAVVVLALVSVRLPARARALVLAIGSVGGVGLVWHVPVLPVLASACGVWGLGRLLPTLPERARSATLAAAVAAVVGTLLWFRAGAAASATLVSTPVVLGLSYFALKYIQHLVDAAGGRAAKVDLPSFIATVFFLPTYPAGPIERSGEFATKLAEPTGAEWAAGVERIVFGVGKKVLLADPLRLFLQPAFHSPGTTSRGMLVLSLYAFAIQLYLDFGAYSDIAIGVARLLGVRVRENFDWPYLQRNLGALWQHWHMSFTSWLRDFLFLPIALRLLRRTRKPLVAETGAQLVTMVACGLWHGVAWNFVAWGVYHGCCLSVLAAWRARRGSAPRPGAMPHAAAVLLTFHVFTLGLVFFGCTMPQAIVFLRRLLLGR